MPAPKRPNTSRATETAAKRRNAERDQRDAERLRQRGWTVIPPEERTRPVRYTTRPDAIEQAILPALGDHADDYDVDAICQETFDYRVDTDQHGNELLNTAGFEQTVTDDEFWEIVARHDRTAEDTP